MLLLAEAAGRRVLNPMGSRDSAVLAINFVPQVSATVAAIIKRGWLEGGQAERDAALQGIHAQVWV